MTVRQLKASPSFAEVIRHAIETRLADVHTALPARVESFNAARQLVDVKPLLKDSHLLPDETVEVTPLPVIRNVPVCFPAGGGFQLTFPIQAGDTVLLVFSERSLDKWLELGGDVDPEDDRMHQLSDAVAIPGLHPRPRDLPGVSSENMEAGAGAGPRVSFRGSTIHLGVSAGENAEKSVAYAEDVISALDDLKTAITTAAFGSMDGGALLQTNIKLLLESWPPSSLGSSTVKVK